MHVRVKGQWKDNLSMGIWIAYPVSVHTGISKNLMIFAILFDFTFFDFTSVSVWYEAFIGLTQFIQETSWQTREASIILTTSISMKENI